MDKELSEHTYRASDKVALEHLKILFEFTTTNNMRKSLLTTLFAYLKEQADGGQDVFYKQVIKDYEALWDFLEELDS